MKKIIISSCKECWFKSLNFDGFTHVCIKAKKDICHENEALILATIPDWCPLEDAKEKE